MKKKWTAHLFTITVMVVALGVASAASAQKPTQPPAKVASPRTLAPKPPTHDTFRGIATKLNTTPDALQSAYQTAKEANPKLTRGQFVAANMLAHNLGEKNPSITTEAILDGLKGGKSVGQTLQSLGLSAKDAAAAQRQANRDVSAAQKATPTAKQKTP